MNGVHDMGGMQDMGPVHEEKNEPVFHMPWEGRVFALRRGMSAWGRWNADARRHAIELLPPADYFRMSYYERHFAALLEMVVQSKFVTREELESGTPAAGTTKATPAMTVEKVKTLVAKGASTSRNIAFAASFQEGQRVRARNIHPLGHTRLPRYARGKIGIIHRSHGVFVFPDTNAHFLGEKPQHVYSVRFAARELWGEQAAPQDSVYLDMWDDYLEPV